MNSSNQLNATHPADIMLSIVAGTIGAFGLPTNFFLLLLILSKYRKRKPHEWLLFTLTLGDFLLCLNNAVFEAFFITNTSRLECKFGGAFQYILGTISFFTPPIVAYNRYLSLYNNPKFLKIFTIKSVFCVSVSILLFGLCWMSPFIITGNLGQDNLGLCGIQLTNPILQTIMVLVLTAVYISYFCLLYFSYKVVAKVRNHKRNIASQIQLQSRLVNETQEIITAMLIISTVPLFAQMPGTICNLLQIFLGPLNPWIVRSAVAPFPLTSAVNAYVTIYVVKNYRKKCLSILKWKSTQATTSASGGVSVVQPIVTNGPTPVCIDL